MKKILITGANSYIGTSFEKYMEQYADEYQVDTVDMVDGTWREKNFSEYDIVSERNRQRGLRDSRAECQVAYEEMVSCKKRTLHR